MFGESDKDHLDSIIFGRHCDMCQWKQRAAGLQPVMSFFSLLGMHIKILTYILGFKLLYLELTLCSIIIIVVLRLCSISKCGIYCIVS